MKVSKYNIYIEENNKFYVFNQMTSALSEIDRELYTLLRKESSLDELSEELLRDLEYSHYVCGQDLVEENILLQANRILRYGNRMARITILPTLECTFRCWYCYESHLESVMSQETADSVISFIRKIIIENKLNVVILDWFGGEPLLHFDEIMYPIGKAIVKLCAEENVKLSHSITTNGYLLNPDMICRMNEIKLNSFQITLDGNSFFHNKTRYSPTDKNTYDTIVNNIISLCEIIHDLKMVLRINYTPKNISTIDDIVFSFPKDVRKKIRISPQIVWQFKEAINEIGDVIKNKLRAFSDNGFMLDNIAFPSYSAGCYVENMLQFVINYDATIFKCTARDFLNKDKSIGHLDKDGNFIANSNYYNYFVSSHFENPKCLACRLLPSCTGMCLQKKVEKALPPCPEEAVYSSIVNRLGLLIQQM